MGCRRFFVVCTPLFAIGIRLARNWQRKIPSSQKAPAMQTHFNYGVPRVPQLKNAAVYLTTGLQIVVYSVGQSGSCRKAQDSPKQLFYHFINIRISFAARYTILHTLHLIYGFYRLFVRSIAAISA